VAMTPTIAKMIMTTKSHAAVSARCTIVCSIVV
jgi:hypothetical protein